MTSDQRSRAARYAAISKSAQATTPEARAALTSAARLAANERFNLPSDAGLTPEARRVIVGNRRRLHLIAAAQKSAAARRLRANQKRRPGRRTTAKEK